jgi:hypothetical protein
MEAAFCAYLGRASSVSAQLVRWLQLAAWLTALLKWFYHSATGHPYASQTVLEWAAGGTLVFLVVVAGGWLCRYPVQQVLLANSTYTLYPPVCISRRP